VLEEALRAARHIDDAESRVQGLVEVAERLPTEDRPGVFGEALNAARNINVADSRANALAEVAKRLGSGQVFELYVHQWVETARVLAVRRRGDCLRDLAAVLPLIQALGGKSAVLSLGRSVALVGAWWP
jgi:hypothetical protein